MSRLGVQKYPEHYDIMANAVAHTSARHIVFELYRELKARQLTGNAKFYVQLFSVIRDSNPTTNLLSRSSRVWHEMINTPSLNHIVTDPLVVSSYQSAFAAETSALAPISEAYGTKSGAARSTIKSTPAIEVQQSAVADVPPLHTSSVETLDPRLERLPEHRSASAEALHDSDVVHMSNPDRLSSSQSIFDAPVTKPPMNNIPVTMDSADAGTMRSMRNALEPFFRQSSNVTNHKLSLNSAREFLQSTASVDIATYNYMIRSAARVSEPAALLDILEEAIDRGLKPDAGTYVRMFWIVFRTLLITQNPIIRSFFQAEQTDEALSLIDRMEVSNVKFDFRTVNEVLRGLLRGKREDAAISFFVDIFQTQSELSLIPGKDGEVNCFSLMIDGLASCGRLEDAQKLLSIMIQRGLEPTLMIYNALIRAAFAQNLVIDAMQYYTLAIQTPELERVNIDWTTEIDELASTIVSGYLMTEHYEEAQQFLNDARAKGRWHNTTPKPFIHFINWFARHERLDEAWNLYDFHKTNFDVIGTFKLKTAVLKSIFLDRGDVFGGLSWARRLQNDGIVLEQPQYYDLISAAMYNGERELGEKLWTEVMDFVKNRGQQIITPLTKVCRQWGLDQSARLTRA
ncbi:protein of unknown function [Taphrina deformans PYCC 5710]|uniref:Pentatricopeptide repeat protein n=1 Tax=Taphrina deformans (strain PYCC 5710 / ATCC 11124 / CBS 356.35 / IMI 108563 / JCM 9778 / NBRC 8474) TaxID=1097556 RepID=R4XE84_TAPDE|nr:protein of unknown function [Taphrina deformans PYCC 5710]|eukprot:CCG82765.1 protein of unknown function [Taphrina deformans PYCC 5710]